MPKICKSRIFLLTLQTESQFKHYEYEAFEGISIVSSRRTVRQLRYYEYGAHYWTPADIDGQ